MAPRLCDPQSRSSHQQFGFDAVQFISKKPIFAIAWELVLRVEDSVAFEQYAMEAKLLDRSRARRETFRERIPSLETNRKRLR